MTRKAFFQEYQIIAIINTTDVNSHGDVRIIAKLGKLHKKADKLSYIRKHFSNFHAM